MHGLFSGAEFTQVSMLIFEFFGDLRADVESGCMNVFDFSNVANWPHAGIKRRCMTFKVGGNFLVASGHLFICVLETFTGLNFSVLSILVFREFD